MKKIALLSLALGTLFISSCSKEKTITDELDGETWKVVKITEVTGSTTNVDNDPKISYVFAKDGGTGTETYASFNLDIKWAVSDDKITITTIGSEIYTVKKSGWSKQTWEQVDGATVSTFELEKQ